jgi:choline dehydrogenase-like flavoprotein
MPVVPSGNTHAPTVMIRERCADFLLENNPSGAQSLVTPPFIDSH